jgi:hypothetical protein
MGQKTIHRHDDPLIIWVAAGGDNTGHGTYEEPFTDMAFALMHAQPGSSIVLTGGVYRNDVTVQTGGVPDRPVIITARQGDEVIVEGGCWYFYDISDVVVSNIQFRNCPHGAISVIGACERNCFSSLRFFGCGTSHAAVCTMFFGGSGARCNVVKNCVFNAPAPDQGPSGLCPHDSIGIMLSEGDLESEGMKNRDHIFSQNVFDGFGCGICIGSRGTGDAEYGHRIESSMFRNCADDAIRIHCGDTTVRDNVVEGCAGNAVSLVRGRGCSVTNNRIERCGTGMRVRGDGHTLRNNCICNTEGHDVHVLNSPGETGSSPSTVFIESNTFIHGSAGRHDDERERIRIDGGTSCVIRNNIFSGRGHAYGIHENGGPRGAQKMNTYLLAQGNIVTGGCQSADGCQEREVPFAASSHGTFENPSGYGAQGWMALGRENEHEPSVMAAAADTDRCIVAHIDALPDEDILNRSLFPHTDQLCSSFGEAEVFSADD